MKAWAAVPAVGTPYRRPASRFDVSGTPPTYAARAAATAACSCTRRLPISIKVRPPAATAMRDAAAATEESKLRIERTSVSSTTACANVASTVSTGDPPKYSSPSR